MKFQEEYGKGWAVHATKAAKASREVMYLDLPLLEPQAREAFRTVREVLGA